MITAEEVKSIVRSLSADLCGIASLDRFENAPEGFHPCDVFPACKSVVSFACRFPVGCLTSSSPTPYTRIRNSITAKLDAIALDFCIEMEKHHIHCVPIPTNESEYDPRTNRWRSVVSQKHAAQAAGLGTIGRHSLLITPEYGSMVWLGTVLCDVELEADELKESICDGCMKCVNTCPVHALDNVDMNQEACDAYAFKTDEVTQVWGICCHACRDICPHNFGTENSF